MSVCEVEVLVDLPSQSLSGPSQISTLLLVKQALAAVGRLLVGVGVTVEAGPQGALAGLAQAGKAWRSCRLPPQRAAVGRVDLQVEAVVHQAVAVVVEAVADLVAAQGTGGAAGAARAPALAAAAPGAARRPRLPLPAPLPPVAEPPTPPPPVPPRLNPPVPPVAWPASAADPAGI